MSPQLSHWRLDDSTYATFKTATVPVSLDGTGVEYVLEKFSPVAL